MKNSSTVNDLNNITKNKQINQQTLIYHNGVIIVTTKKNKNKIKFLILFLALDIIKVFYSNRTKNLVVCSSGSS